MSSAPSGERPTAMATERKRRMLITALGPDISTAMRDDQVVEIMVNPDGALSLDRLGEGRIDPRVRMAPDQVERIIRLGASHGRAESRGENPITSAELPATNVGKIGNTPS